MLSRRLSLVTERTIHETTRKSRNKPGFVFVSVNSWIVDSCLAARRHYEQICGDQYRVHDQRINPREHIVSHDAEARFERLQPADGIRLPDVKGAKQNEGREDAPPCRQPEWTR